MEEKLREMKKKCPQFIKADLYSVAEIIFVLAIVLFVIASKGNIGTERNRKWILVSGLAVPTVCCIAQFFFGKAKVNNWSGTDVEYLKEGGGANRPSYILSTGDGQHDVDGIRSNDVIYKIPDGVHVTVRPNGKVVPHSIAGKFLYWTEGGALDNPPDASWNALFPEEKRI